MADPTPPYGQPDRKISGFFLCPALVVPWYLSRCVHRSSFVFVDQMFLRIFLFVTSDVLTLLLIMFKYYFLQSLFRLFLLLQHCATLAIGRRPRPEAFAFYRRNTRPGHRHGKLQWGHACQTQDIGNWMQTPDKGQRTQDKGRRTQDTGYRAQDTDAHHQFYFQIWLRNLSR